MTSLRFAFAAWWFCFGLYLVVAGVGDTLRWQNDPYFSGMSLRWWHSTHIIPGAMAMTYALALAANWRPYRALGYIVGAFFVLDYLYLLAITTEAGRMSGWGAWRAFVIIIGVATLAFNVWVGRGTHQQSARPR